MRSTLESVEALKKVIEAAKAFTVSPEDFKNLAKQVLEIVREDKRRNEKQRSEMEQRVSDYVSAAELKAIEQVLEKESVAKETIIKMAEDTLNRIRFEHEAMVSEAQKKMDGVKNGKDGAPGKDADEEKIVGRVLARVPVPQYPKKEVDAIYEEIKKLEERLSKAKTGQFIGPSRGVFLKVNGVKQGITSELNLVGSGVAFTKVNGLPTVTITGGSGATAVETPTGTVNGVNNDFTVANEPIYIIVDGISKFETLHYTYLAGAITITDGASPTQYIRSVYSA